MPHDYVEFFRFEDCTIDVFWYEGKRLIAFAEPFGWAYLMACRHYDKKTDTFGEPFGLSAEKLDTLTRVDEMQARRIIDSWLTQCE